MRMFRGLLEVLGCWIKKDMDGTVLRLTDMLELSLTCPCAEKREQIVLALCSIIYE
jgi:hypothetical protein